VKTADINTKNLAELTTEADIIITGVGKSGLIKADMVKEGVVLIDAGTSESAGKIVGDIDPACAEKCSLFTPVPGGVGPITVAILFKNLAELN
jgi:methylenetetrahydrofolate dehydrogenase (NADP+)/methenyltetrahydrofolate cyclohydrolase